VKRLISFALLALVVFQIFAVEPWPELEENTWTSMTKKELLRILLVEDVNARREYGETALMWAAAYSDSEVVVDSQIILTTPTMNLSH
jgi:hypothetical protein